MSFFARLSRALRSRIPGRASAVPVEQAVIIHLKISEAMGSLPERERILALQDDLRGLIDREKLGEFDGDEWGAGECVVYLYTPDARKLWAAIEKAVRAGTPSGGGFVDVRLGPPGSFQDTVYLPGSPS